jgi:hypothetical protein
MVERILLNMNTEVLVFLECLGWTTDVTATLTPVHGITGYEMLRVRQRVGLDQVCAPQVTFYITHQIEDLYLSFLGTHSTEARRGGQMGAFGPGHRAVRGQQGDGSADQREVRGAGAGEDSGADWDTGELHQPDSSTAPGNRFLME